jgi:hypothetical protein
VFSAGPGNVDAAVLGTGRGIGGGGVLATVTFQARGSGDPKVGIAKADARDATNQKVALTAGQPETPLATAFDLAAPNPFGSTTTLSFSLAKGGPVELAIFSVDGRRVKMLDAGSRAAGIYHFAWNGMDDGGHTVQPGLFFARLVTPEGHFTRTLVMVK